MVATRGTPAHAPVCVRFRGYGVAMDDVAQAYCDAVLALPAMREWLADAVAEPERLAATDGLAAP